MNTHASTRYRNELCEVLRRLLRLYERALSVSREKTTALTENKIDNIKNTTGVIQQLGEQIEQAEEARGALMEKISGAEGQTPGKLTLRALAGLWEDEEVLALRGDLRRVLAELKKVSERNALLVGQAQKVYSFLSQIYYSAFESRGGYNAQGNREKRQGGYFEGEV
ncbi:MAG: hypothetical protein GF333_05170 [Candidatus Omnitrophica bacterium]|nr:hypothetical protein [Candidatus Omnitrophota bacterium]